MSWSVSGSSGRGGNAPARPSRTMRITRSDHSPRAGGTREGASDGLMRVRIPLRGGVESGPLAGAVSRQVLEGVVGGVLVQLGPGGDVEGGVQETVHRPVGVHHGLADVDQFGGVLADDVNT